MLTISNNNMLLRNFGYNGGTWATDLMDLNPQNLVVGKNAVGKSMTIRRIAEVADVISGRKSVEDVDVLAVYAIVLKHDENTEFIYEFGWTGSEVSVELLKVYDLTTHIYTTLIDRTPERTILDGEAINPPNNNLVIHTRRDVIKYPYIETLISWASNVEGLYFNELEFDGDLKMGARMQSDGINLYAMVKSLNEDSIRNVIEMANRVGYELTEIEPVELGTLKGVLFTESGVVLPMFCSELSKGMFRTLYLLIYIEYMTHNQMPSTLLIDDLCEGLDYERSTKLGKLVFEYCEKNNIQLIASSNDSFLMDVVDLKYWNILQRDETKVVAINKTNNPELFENFKFTGLSNFDLFSSDFINRHKADK